MCPILFRVFVEYLSRKFCWDVVIPLVVYEACTPVAAYLRPDDAPDGPGDFIPVDDSWGWELVMAAFGLTCLRLILALAACKADPLLLWEIVPVA